MWNSGQITSETPYWAEGMSDWAVMQDFQSEFESSPPPALPVKQPDNANSDVEKQILFESQKKSAGVACLLNFVLPGIGYMYAGRVIIGLFVLGLWGVMFLLGFLTLGITWIICSLIWLVGIIDGFLCVDRANKKLAQKVLKS